MEVEQYPPSERRLKILWISHLVPYPPKGGVLMRSYHLVHELARHHDVDVFALNQSRLLRAYFPDLATGIAAAREHLGSFLRRFEIGEIPSEKRRWGRYLRALTSLVRSKPYSINWLESWGARRQIERWLADGDYDAVHFDTISLAVYHHRGIRCPTVMDHHNIESHMMFRRAEQEPHRLKRWYYRQEARRLLAYEKKMLRRFSAHIVCSEDDRQRLLEIDPCLQVQVVPNGIALQPNPKPRQPVQPPRLLFIGGLDWYPNQDAMHFFIDSLWDEIKATIPGVEMHVVGKNPSGRIAETAARDPQFKVHGYVDDITDFYAQALAYVCPIRDGGGTKLKVLDALAHELPIVAHPLACEGIEVVEGTHVFMAQTAADFAAGIRRLQDAELNRAMGKRGGELIRDKYNFRTIGVDLSNLFRSLVAAARPGRGASDGSSD
jgi:polysaccharide biosynthesis protein PslH